MAEQSTDTKSKAQRLTAVLLIVPLLAWGIYDIVIYWLRGGVATISTVIGGWLAWSYWIVAAFGLLCGHLLGSAPEDQRDWNRAAVFTTTVMLGFAFTRMR
jgi:hypothetical protein